jgi:CRP-like cAMP-binding protein
MTSDDRQVQLLEELVTWIKFSNRGALLEAWDVVLKDDRQLLAYELSDGVRTQKEVGEGAGLSQPTVSQLWGRWRKAGLVRIVSGRAAHLARPSEMGLERAEKLVKSKDASVGANES